MFIGQYEHQLESKGRLSIPKKFRSQLDEGAIVSQGLDGCLFLYPKSTWEQLIQKLSQLSLTKTDARQFVRSITFGASEVEIDQLGRILIPDYLKKWSGIESSCIVAGALERIEIWDKNRFEAIALEINNKREAIAEKLDIS